MNRLNRTLAVCCALLGGVASSPAQAPSDLRRWALSIDPALRIGAEGDPNKEFQRITGVALMPSGDMVVANSASQELRVFSGTGAFVQSLSRRGDGPGEFSNLGSLARVADTLFVMERAPGPSRLHVFTWPGGFRTRTLLRAVNAANAPRGVAAQARLTSGELLVTPGGFVRVVARPLGTVWRDSLAVGVLRVGDPGEVLWLGTLPNNSWYSYALSSGPVRTTLARFTLGPSLILGVSADRVWIGDSGTGVISAFDATAKQVGTFSAPFPTRPFSASALDRAKQRALDGARDANARSRFEALYDPAIRPRTAPRFTRFLAGTDGELWLEAFEEDPAASRQVIVLARTGRPIATLTVPPGVTLHEVGPDYALGVETDADGIERVVKFRLRR